MRHKVAGRSLGRSTNHRKALRRNLIADLLRYGKIKTTLAKAKSVRGQAEKFITLARNRGDAERLIEMAEDHDETKLKSLLTDAQTGRLLRLVDDGDQDGLEREAKAISAHAQRLVARNIADRELLTKLFSEIAPRYQNRPGGYTRVVRLGQRKGDAAEIVLLSLVEEEL